MPKLHFSIGLWRKSPRASENGQTGLPFGQDRWPAGSSGQDADDGEDDGQMGGELKMLGMGAR